MTQPKYKPICSKCGRKGRRSYYHKGKILCFRCIRKLPSYRLQESVMIIYQWMRKNKLKRTNKYNTTTKGLNTSTYS